MSRLHDLQMRFQNYLLGESDAIEADIVSTENALAEHRLGTYYNAYRIRLIDGLAINYPALEKHLGREAFEYLILDYLKLYPSSHASVRWVGKHLPAYLERVYSGEDREFLTELAGYEWAKSLVFDAADENSLFHLEDMAQIAPQDWPGLAFRFKPALRWIDLYWNIPAVENALERGETVPTASRSEHPQRWLLWRREYKTYWRSLEVHEAWALEQAVDGANFASVCEGLLEWVDQQQVALVAAGFLKQWISDELIVSLDR